MTQPLALLKYVFPLGVGCTVTVAAAVLLPSVVVTVMVAVPSATPVTTPVAASTVAIAVSLEDHVTAGFVAFVGATVAVKAPVVPTTMLSAVGVTAKSFDVLPSSQPANTNEAARAALPRSSVLDSS